MPDISRIIGRAVAPDQSRSPWLRFGFAVVLPILAFLPSWLIFNFNKAPYFTLFVTAVVIAALFGGQKAGLVSTAFSTLLAFLASPPAWTIRLADSEDSIRIATFFILGCALSFIIGAVGELQRKLDRERRKLSTTLLSIGDAVITTDNAGKVTFLNEVAKRIMGCTSADAEGKPLSHVFNVLDEKTRQSLPNPVQRALQSGTPVGLDSPTLLVRKDGTEIPIDDSAAPIRDEWGRIHGAVLVFRDITEQREKDRALMQAEKLASVGRLASTLAHEINNPLEAIGNLLYLIEFAADLNAARALAQSALHQANRAAHAAHQTLSYARISNARASVELQPIITNLLTLYGNRITNKNIRVLTRFAQNCAVDGNSNEMQQVVANLLSNALDALNGNGILQVRVARSGRAVRLVVADTGIGIPQEHMPKLFEAFFTTKPDVGTGLGLWITKQVVESHQGRIRIRSKINRGTVVRVCLPSSVTEPTAPHANLSRKGVLQATGTDIV